MRPVADIHGFASRRIRRADALVPGLLGVAGSVEIVAGPTGVWVGLATYWLAVGILCARRVAPLALPVTVGIVYASAPALGYDVSLSAAWILVLAFACLGAGLEAPRSQRVAGLASVLACLAVAVAGLAWFTRFEPNLLFGLIVLAGPWALGAALRDALEHQRRLGAETEHARVSQGLAAERAAAAERRRISAELHDALAHALGALVVQASVAGDLVRRDPAAAPGALEAVAQGGREALGETGRLLRLLRDDRDELGLRLAATPDPEGERGTDAGPPVASSRSIRRADLLLPALFGVIGTAELAWYGAAPLWASIGVHWLAVGVLCARRALPLAMPVAVAGILVGGRLLGVPSDEPSAGLLAIALACFSAGLHVPRSRAAAGLASVLAAFGLSVMADAMERGAAYDILLQLGLIGPWAVGVALAETLAKTRVLAAEAERVRIEEELAHERAAAVERKRIARELHDMLANSFSVMIVQASVAADAVGTDPRAAAAAVAEVERAGRTALGDTGRLLRLAGDDPDGAGTHPQHGVADLPTLAEGYARAGLAIELDVGELDARLPLGVELSTYRIVQEALTNALKHAPGSPVRVRLARDGAGVAIEVRNGRTGAAALSLVPGGHGLVGLRERVSLFGGALDAGPTPDGGFNLVATLPVDGRTT